MSYKVKFSSGFDWTQGGKLPGLCGGGTAACPRHCALTAAVTKIPCSHVLLLVVVAISLFLH